LLGTTEWLTDLTELEEVKRAIAFNENPKLCPGVHVSISLYVYLVPPEHTSWCRRELVHNVLPKRRQRPLQLVEVVADPLRLGQ